MPKTINVHLPLFACKSGQFSGYPPYISHVCTFSTFLENTLKSGRQVALGSNPWEQLDDDLYLIWLASLYSACQHGLISTHYPVNFLNAFNYNHSILAPTIIFISHWSFYCIQVMREAITSSAVHLKLQSVPICLWQSSICIFVCICICIVDPHCRASWLTVVSPPNEYLLIQPKSRSFWHWH